MTMFLSKKMVGFAAIILLMACERTQPVPPEASAHDIFFERLSLLCGSAFSGQLVSDDKVDNDMRDKAMIMHVANCTGSKIEIPFHVEVEDGNWNRSRTWIITHNDEGLILKHQHLHEDGSPDLVTNYGGIGTANGTAEKQQFEVDQESIDMFRKNDLVQSVTNIWSLELSAPGKKDARFAYQLNRADPKQSRNFRAEFNLTVPIDPPPPAWGS